MASISWRLAVLFGLLCICSSGVCSTRIQSVVETASFENKYVFFDKQPLKNNSLLYAGCNLMPDNLQQSLECSVYLWSYPTAKKVTSKCCELNQRSNKGTYLLANKYQLKPLHSDKVIFMWREWDVTEQDKHVVQLGYRTLDMSSCKASDPIRIPFEVENYHEAYVLNDVHVVPHEDSFDLFFQNKSLCGDHMCRQTQDMRTNRITNGPVASYLPSENVVYPRETRVVCPVKHGSSELGYFSIASESKLSLINSNSGGVKHLMNFPGDVYDWTFSCDNGFLGFCWKSPVEDELNCEQFDSQGERTMHVKLGKFYGRYMAVNNLRDGGMLLFTRNGFLPSDEYVVYKIHKVGGSVRLRRLDNFSDSSCDAFWVSKKLEIHEKENGDACLSLACYDQKIGRANSEVYLSARCFNIAEAERDSPQDPPPCARWDLYCLPPLSEPLRIIE